jgi:hypothetical protein
MKHISKSFHKMYKINVRAFKYSIYCNPQDFMAWSTKIAYWTDLIPTSIYVSASDSSCMKLKSMRQTWRAKWIKISQHEYREVNIL